MASAPFSARSASTSCRPRSKRLGRIERRPSVRYEMGKVGLRPDQELERERDESILPATMRFDTGVRDRSSSTMARRLTGTDHEREVFNAGARVRYSTRRIAIDDYAAAHDLRVDILKVDTDGCDMEVLRGAQSVLDTTCLCVIIETMFHSPLSPYANSFAQIDRYLRERGFSLFTLQPFPYTRAALPGSFVYDMFAQTRDGQVDWADCVYARDVAAARYEDVFGFRPDVDQILALACIFEQLELSDCAAELLILHADRLPCPASQLLDLLVPDTLGTGLTYADFIERFKAEPARLFPTRQQRRIESRAPIVAHQVCAVPVGSARTDPSWGATLTPTDHDGLRVTTAALPWAYAAMVPVGTLSGSGWVSIELHVEEGRVGVSLMGAAIQDIWSEVFIESTAQPARVWLPVTDPQRVRHVLVRNATGTERVSRFVLTHVEVFSA